MAQISFSIVVVCLNPGEKLLKTVQSVSVSYTHLTLPTTERV